MKKLQIFGDSVMKSVIYCAEDNRYRLNSQKFSLDGVEIVNRSKMGNTIENGKKTVSRFLSGVDRDTVVLVEYGGNDCNFNWAEISDAPDSGHICAVPPESFILKYIDVLEMLKSTGARVVVSTLPPISAEKFMNHLSIGLNYDNILRWLGDIEHLSRWQACYSALSEDAAQRCGCEIMPLRTAVESEKWETMVCMDGLHPNPDGYRLVHAFMKEYLLKKL